MPTTRPYRPGIVLALLLVPVLAGCSSFQKRKISVPAPCVYPTLFDAPRGSKEPIDYSDLRQQPPSAYQLGPEDVLGIYIEGVLGEKEAAPPVHYPRQEHLAPAIGYPIPVREDGTIAVPLVTPIDVAGMTLTEASKEIQKAYTVGQKILQPGRDRIIVTLMKSRTYHVLVVREDTGAPLASGRTYRPEEVILEPPRRGRTYALELPAYQNDVLHALCASGGLPGVDAKNHVRILRGVLKDAEQRKDYREELESLLTGEALEEMADEDRRVLTIPLQIGPGDPPLQLTQEDITLGTGDIVVVESRESEVFYTGGMLKGGQHPIPRDYDLDVLGAIAMAGGSVAASAGGSGTVRGVNMGGSSIFPPTRVTVLRTTGGRQVSIAVDLRRAVLDPRERILIQPNDFILLEYRTGELIANVVLNNVGVNLSGPLWK